MASITKRAGKKGITYKVTIRKKGYPTQTETFKKLTDAKKWAADTESAIDNGKHFQSAEAKKHTISELIDRYIEREMPAKVKSQSTQIPQLEWWRREIGHNLLSNVTPALLGECRERLKGEKTYKGTPKSGATVNRYLAVLSDAFTKAVKEWQWMQENPLSKVSRSQEPKGRVRFLSDEERCRLLDSCKNSRNTSLYLIVMLALSTGARQGEILRLTWDNVSFEQRRIILKDTKNGETRSVPLVSVAYDLLREHSKVRRIDTDLVFPRAAKTATFPTGDKPMSIREAWENAVAAAGIADFRFHDLRHSCASYLAMNGATLAEIAEVLGHKTLQMVKRYAHLSEQHTLSVVERMNQKIFGV